MTNASSRLRQGYGRPRDNAFHLRADESRWIGFSEDDVSKEAEHFRNAESGDSRVDRESPKKRGLKQTLRSRRRCATRPRCWS
jgi:hypothetical protein